MLRPQRLLRLGDRGIYEMVWCSGLRDRSGCLEIYRSSDPLRRCVSRGTRRPGRAREDGVFVVAMWSHSRLTLHQEYHPQDRIAYLARVSASLGCVWTSLPICLYIPSWGHPNRNQQPREAARWYLVYFVELHCWPAASTAQVAKTH